jgi:hypothetical protein
MSNNPVVNPGRLDELAVNLLKQGVRVHGNPVLRIACKVLDSEINQALTETLGPGTKADELGRIVREWERRIRQAMGEVEEEDRR